jgi:hypothetical protein
MRKLHAVKPHVRSLLENVEPPIFELLGYEWPEYDIPLPDEFRVRLLCESSWSWRIEFIAPAWKLLVPWSPWMKQKPALKSLREPLLARVPIRVIET